MGIGTEGYRHRSSIAAGSVSQGVDIEGYGWRLFVIEVFVDSEDNASVALPCPGGSDEVTHVEKIPFIASLIYT